MILATIVVALYAKIRFSRCLVARVLTFDYQMIILGQVEFVDSNNTLQGGVLLA